MNQFNILGIMEEKYGEDGDNDDLYTFGGVLEYDLIEEDKLIPGGSLQDNDLHDNVMDDETNGKLYLDDMPELDELVNKKEGGSGNSSVKQDEFLKFLNKLSKLEK